MMENGKIYDKNDIFINIIYIYILKIYYNVI